jgi:hypothetical protein
VTQVEAGRVIFSVSRLVCDVERFPLDEQEPMVARGMGRRTRSVAAGVIESGEGALGGHWGRDVLHDRHRRRMGGAAQRTKRHVFASGWMASGRL